MSEISDSLREVMRGWPTGVAVVTSSFNGQTHGMTVNSLTSVSLEPPVVTVSLANQSRTWKLVSASKIFAVTLLDATQQNIADIFSGKVSEDEDRFAGLETMTLVSGAPLLRSGRAHLDCVVLQSIELPKSTIFIGEVRTAQGDLNRPPLVYLNRGYRKVNYE
jgi:flavin reductase (DIM6/NTAB) family NADH-FMN oxidoreductase RutF